MSFVRAEIIQGLSKKGNPGYLACLRQLNMALMDKCFKLYIYRPSKKIQVFSRLMIHFWFITKEK